MRIDASTNELLIEPAEMVVAISAYEQRRAELVDNFLRKSRSTGNSCLPFLQEPCISYIYSGLSDKYKRILQKQYGDPYQYVAKNPIRKLVEKDFKAEEFYLSYKYNSDKSLPISHKERYTTAASWLNMILKMTDNKVFIKKSLNLKMDAFYKHVCEIIKTDGIELPTDHGNLRRKIKAYQEKGYVALIDWRFGNDNSAKITDATSEGMLLKMIEHPNQYDDVMVAYMYNDWAGKNDYEAISVSSVTNWRKKKACEITTGRYGKGAFNEKFIRQVKGLAPTRVGMMWESDDNNLDFYYQRPSIKGKDGKTIEGNAYERYVSYIVADSKTGLILGKCYRMAKSPIMEMVRLAYIDAMYYVRSLTGGWHLPFEVKTDHWQEKNLFPFFESIAAFVPPSHGNKHRGYIEQLFGSPHFKRAQKLATHHEGNYNGNNVTAINRGVNMEALVTNQKNRPTIGAAAENQIEKFFELTRKMPAFTKENMNAQSKEALWLANWETLNEDEKRPISDEKFLLTFGFKHEPQGRPISITNRGVEPQINGIKYSYDLPENIDLKYHIDRKVWVYYDPYDMSRVLVTDDKGFRCICTNAVLHPRALQDTHANSRTLLNMVLADKKKQVGDVGAKAAQRAEIEEADYEMVALGFAMPKELKNSIEANAEKVLLKNGSDDKQWQDQYEDFLNENNDFDRFYK